MTTKAQQITMDNALVAPENQCVIGKCNMRINPGMKPKESTYQVVLDALALTTCYLAFLITAEVPRFSVNVEVFRDILNICPRISGQEFNKPLTEEEALSFIRELGHSREIKYITGVIIDHMHQPWRTFASIINKCICGKDLAYQIDNKDSKKQDKMFYPRFTKIIIHHFLEKDKSISMRNRMFMHTARDDSLLGTMRFVSRHEDAQIYGAILPKAMTNQAMLDSVAYKTYYAIASGAEPPKSKKPKTKSDSAISSEETPSKKKPTKAKKDVPSKKKPASKPKPTKKKAPVKADRGKGLNVLSEVALSEAAQLKEATKRSKKDFHISQASGSGDGTDFESGVPDEQQRKTSGADEGTGTKPGVLDVPKYLSESENESWGDSDDDESNDDNSDEVTKDDDESDANDDKEASDSEKTYSNKDENLNLNQNYDEEKEKKRMSKVAEHEEVGKGDIEMTDTTHESAYQEKSYEQVIKDAHVTLTSSQKTKGSKQSFSVSSGIASKFLNLDNIPPVIDEVASMMNVKTPHEELCNQAPLNLSVLMTTPTHVPTTEPKTSSIHALPDFTSLFRFDQRVSALEQELSQVKQIDHSAQILSQIPVIVDEHLSTRIGFDTKTTLQNLRESSELEKEKYIDIIEKSVKEIIKDEVTSQLPQILPKEISNFATPVIQSTINESLENVVLAKSFSQPRSTYEAATSITKFDLKKILLDKLEKSKPYRPVEQHRDLCDALVKSYQLDKDLFDSYGKTYSLKRGHEDKDKDEDPPADQTKGSKSQSKSSSKSAQAEEPVFETVDTKMPQDQGDDLGNTEDQSNVEEASKNDWFKKPKRPPTPDRDWNAGNQINFRPPQTWINKMAKVEKPPTTFDELINTPIDFSAYVLGHLKIENLTQECLVGLAFNLLKRTCKSRVELEYHFEECYKAVNDRLDLHNPEEHVYPFNLSKPLPLIEDQGRQVVPANYFFNNDLEYLKGGSSSGKYTTSTTKTNAAKYDNIEGIKDMLQMLWSPVKKSSHDVYSKKRIIIVTRVKVIKWYDYGYLEEIEVRKEDHKLYKFKEGDFPRLNLRDTEDMLLLLV
ncbi:hypothetical protein Tco_0060891 [Tanacetum coccineum]